MVVFHPDPPCIRDAHPKIEVIKDRSNEKRKLRGLTETEIYKERWRE